MKNNLGNEIERLISSHHLTRKKLASSIGVPYSTLSDWINGKVKPRNKKLELLANFFDITIDELLGKPNNIHKIDSWQNIPIVGSIACGTPILANENIEGFQPIPSNLVSQDNVFALECHGNSMEPTIKNGALVVIHQQPEVEDGEVAAVLINNDATLKRVKHIGNQIILSPDNKEYDPIVLNKNDDNRILGKMILQINKY